MKELCKCDTSDNKEQTFMYYVYEITFKDGSKYVGCTNNLRRRKDQHNENARKTKSKLGSYLESEKIILKQNDLKVIATFVIRQDALNYERKVALAYDKNGITLQNDTYTHNCSRLGKRKSAFMEYYVIDLEKGTATYVNDLKTYAEQVLGIHYSQLQRTVHKSHYCLQRYKAYQKDVWLDLENKDYYLSKQTLIDIEEKVRQLKKKNYSKKYLLLKPNGETEIIVNADQYAKDHNISAGTLHSTLTTKKSVKGYKLLKKIGD